MRCTHRLPVTRGNRGSSRSSSSGPFSSATGSRTSGTRTAARQRGRHSLLDGNACKASDRARARFGAEHRYRNPSCWIDTDVGFDDLLAIECCNGHSDGGSGEPGKETGAEKGSGNETDVSPVVGISTVGTGIISDPLDGVAILTGLLMPTGGRENSNNIEREETNGSSCDASTHSGRNPVAFPILPGRKTRTRTGGHNEANRDCNAVGDPPWLRTVRDQITAFCSSEGILLPSQKNLVSDETETETENAPTGDSSSNGTTVTTSDHGEATAAVVSAAPANTENENSHDQIDLVCLGPLTNLARWLEEMPGFASDRLNSVWILGGNLPVPAPGTNENTEAEGVRAEFNFARDPEAVRRVFSHEGLHGIPIHLVPQEVCDRSAFEASFLRHYQQQQQQNARTGDPTVANSLPKVSAAKIIEDWLQSSLLPPETQQLRQPHARKSARTTTRDSIATTSTVSSLLPTWIVRLIQTRTYSVYGDPICIYVRDNCYECISTSHPNNKAVGAKTNGDCESNIEGGNGFAERRPPKIRWKEYSTKRTCDNAKDIIKVDSDGRLVFWDAHDSNWKEADGSVPSTTNTADSVDGNFNDQQSILQSPTDEEASSSEHGGDSDESITIRVAHEVELGPIYLDWLTKALTSSAPEDA